MTLFAAESAAETPSWMRQYQPNPDADHTEVEWRARRWSQAAEQDRDQTVRLWLLEDRGDNGLVLRRWHIQTTPKAAWWWVHTTTVPAGHRLVLTEVKK